MKLCSNEINPRVNNEGSTKVVIQIASMAVAWRTAELVVMKLREC